MVERQCGGGLLGFPSAADDQSVFPLTQVEEVGLELVARRGLEDVSTAAVRVAAPSLDAVQLDL